MHRCNTGSPFFYKIVSLGTVKREQVSPVLTTVVFSWWDYTVSFPLSLLSSGSHQCNVCTQPPPLFHRGICPPSLRYRLDLLRLFSMERESGAEKARNRNWISLKLSKGLFIDALTSIPQYNHNGWRPIWRDGRRLKASLLITYGDALHELVLSSVVICGWGVERDGCYWSCGLMSFEKPWHIRFL